MRNLVRFALISSLFGVFGCSASVEKAAADAGVVVADQPVDCSNEVRFFN